MRIISPELRESILKEYYFKHYSKLINVVKQQLELNNRALILDCHSFPKIPMKRNEHKIVPRPDFNIITAKFYTPRKLIEISINFFKEKNLKLGIHYLFSGTLVPMEYYIKN